MPETGPARHLNDILDLLDLVAVAELFRQTNGVRTYEPSSQHPLSLGRENVRKFDSAIDDLLRSLPDAESTLSEERLLEELIPEIQHKKVENSRFTQEEYRRFCQKILALPITKYRILRPIYGVKPLGDAQPVHFGNFVIYNATLHLGQIMQGLALPPWADTPSGLLIECEVAARDGSKAEELADAQFYRFELIVRFFIGRRTTEFEVGVLNYAGPQMRKVLVIAGGGFSEGSAWKGSLQQIPIADPFFCKPPLPFTRLLEIFVRQSNELESHVVRCVEWTAQAMGDPNAASAFVKAAIALEVLFSQNERAVITPSIMAQIAEGCAFILGSSPSSAADIEHEVKRLYGIRSAVVHSGKDSVSKYDLNSIIDICCNVVLALLSSSELDQIKSMEGLAQHFRKKKYHSVGAGEP